MMATSTPSTPLPSVKDETFPTAAIVVLAVGGYLVLFVIGVIIRKCIINNTGCPSWCSEVCQCTSCGCGPYNNCECIAQFAKSCNCCQYPNKQKCMDACCPTKQWCDDTFCFCMSQQPHGECCKCDDCCKDCCPDCSNMCDCPECKNCCEDCKCECCAQPETIDCCCIEVKLSGSANRPLQGGVPHGQGAPFPNQSGGYNMNQGGYMMNPGGYNMNQSGYMNPGGFINQQPNSSFIQSPGNMLNQPPAVAFNQNNSASQMMMHQPAMSRTTMASGPIVGGGGPGHHSFSGGANMFQSGPSQTGR